MTEIARHLPDGFDLDREGSVSCAITLKQSATGTVEIQLGGEYCISEMPPVGATPPSKSGR